MSGTGGWGTSLPGGLRAALGSFLLPVQSGRSGRGEGAESGVAARARCTAFADARDPDRDQACGRGAMSLPEWHIAVKLADQPLAPKSILRLPEAELGECPLGGCSISYLKQLITGKLQESVPDPELIDLIYCGRKLRDDQTLDFYGIQSGSTVHVLRKSWPEPDQKAEPVDKVAAVREFRVLHTALHSSSAYRDAVFKMLGNKESLDQIVVATPGLSSDPIALGVLQDKDLFSVFADPNMLDTLIPTHPALVNAIILVLHSVAGSTPLPAPETSRSMPSSSYRDMPGGFLFEGLSDDEDDFHQSTRSTPSSSTSGSRPASLGYTGAAGPRPITQSELATALALASTPESSSHTPTPGTQGHSSGTSPMSSSVQSGTPITNDLFSQALQHALQASGQPSLQSQWQPQLQQLRDMGIHDDELSQKGFPVICGCEKSAIGGGGCPHRTASTTGPASPYWPGMSHICIRTKSECAWWGHPCVLMLCDWHTSRHNTASIRKMLPKTKLLALNFSVPLKITVRLS
ncbi:ubiquitin-like protein 7 [Alligator mississippiensis]|uniref:Ubiquitin-like protein 7 n=1 Tax=Alligator mississippiensis TaxID=8496 RepID=A0A151MAH7_ALLMI|nr:ubiquitin-like protein 7 [Alligator mississippiensis]